MEYLKIWNLKIENESFGAEDITWTQQKKHKKNKKYIQNQLMQDGKFDRLSLSNPKDYFKKN